MKTIAVGSAGGCESAVSDAQPVGNDAAGPDRDSGAGGAVAVDGRAAIDQGAPDKPDFNKPEGGDVAVLADSNPAAMRTMDGRIAGRSEGASPSQAIAVAVAVAAAAAAAAGMDGTIGTVLR